MNHAIKPDPNYEIYANLTKDTTRHTLRRNQLALEATKHFENMGYAGTNLRKLADDINFNSGLLRYYFREKPDIFYACVEINLSRFEASCQALAAQRNDTKKGFEPAVDFLYALLVTNRSSYSVFVDFLIQAIFNKDFFEHEEKIVTRFNNMHIKIFKSFDFNFADSELNMRLYLLFIVDFLKQTAHLDENFAKDAFKKSMHRLWNICTNA